MIKVNGVIRFNMMSKCALIVILTAAISATAQTKTEKIDELMNRYFSNGQFNGNILVAEKGKILYMNSFGFADLEWRIPNTLDTKFRIASVTKPFTALLVLQCIENGRINFNGYINDYLSGFPPAIGDVVTISQLLSHTSGLIDYPDIPGGFDEVERLYHTPQRMLKYITESELRFEPGTQFRYSNFGYYLLGVILEQVTGESYETLIQKNICIPAGMQNTLLDLNSPIIRNRARGYHIDLFKGPQNAPILDMSVAYAAGGLLSTVHDLYLFDQILYTDKLLSDSSKTFLFTPVLNDYANGWEKKLIPIGNTDQTVEIMQHPGSINGFEANIRRFLKDSLTIITITNMKEDPYVGMILAGGSHISRNISAILYEQDYDLPKRSAVYEITKILTTSGADSAIDLYFNLKETKTDRYYFSEMDLNRLGLKLFFIYNNFADAIKILKLNIREYPESYNVYDSIGYVYMNHGDGEKALHAFKKGVQIYHTYPRQNIQYTEDYNRALKHINRLEEEHNN